MKKQSLFVLIAYFLLTVLMTWPTVLHLTDAIPGDGFDGWQNYWNLWWVKQALLIRGTSPYFTDYLYPPTGVSLLFHTLNILNGLWSLPIQLNLGLALAYNSVVFFSFALAGYGGYLLALYTLTQLKFATIKGLRLAAFAGGLVFTMSPFHMAHLLGHMQVFSMIWPPFYILWLLRTLKPRTTGPAAPSPPQWRNAALTCLFLILATLIDWYHTLYLLIFTGLVLVWVMGRQWWILSEQRSKLRPAHLSPRSPASQFLDYPLLRPLWIILAIWLGFAVVMSPLLVPMIRAASNRPDLQTGLVQNVTLSADLLAFVTPSEMHPGWGAWAKRIADNFSATTSERLIFAGYVPLLLGIIAIARSWSKPMVRFWALVATAFVVMAVGPFLHIGGQVVAIGNRPIPMPYLLLYHTIPFIGLTRSLSRYDLMVMLALGVLVAIALAHLSVARYGLANFRARNTVHVSGLISLLAILLICFEYLPVPYPISKIDTPQFYFDIAQQPGEFTIAELPMNWDRPTPLLHQTTHGKKLLTAYTSRNNPLELAWRTPVLQHWRYLGPDIIDQPLAAIAPTIFDDFNLRYIVLDYWQMPPGPEREATEKWVAAALPGINPIYDDGRLKVYQAPEKEETRPYLSLGNGWNDRRESGSGQVTRSFVATSESQAQLLLHHPQEQALVLEITAAAQTPQTLKVFLADEPIGQFEVTRAFATQTIDLPLLSSSIVKLSLRAENPANSVSVRRVGLQTRGY